MKIKKSKQQDKKVDAFLGIDRKVAVFKELDDKIKALGNEKNLIRDELMEEVQLIGTKDDKGNVFIVTSRFKVTRQKRVSTSLMEEETLALLDSKGLRNEAVTMEPVINEDAIVRLTDEGKLTEQEVKAVVNEREVFALTVTEVKKRK